MEVNVSWYQVNDMNAAKKFYGEVLGLKKTFEMDGWCEFSHGEGSASIGLNQLREGDDERGATVVLRVDDLAQVQNEGLCQLINKTGVCWQCKGLNEFAGPGHNSGELVQIEVAPGIDVTSESLFDSRLRIVRETGFPESKTSKMHDQFFEGLTRREESGP